MYHIIKDDVYYLYSDDDHQLLTIKLSDEPGNQIIISTDKEVYAGPIKFITFYCDR